MGSSSLLLPHGSQASTKIVRLGSQTLPGVITCNPYMLRLNYSRFQERRLKGFSSIRVSWPGNTTKSHHATNFTHETYWGDTEWRRSLNCNGESSGLNGGAGFHRSLEHVQPS